MGFLGFSCVYAMRVNLSVAIVAMVAKNVTYSANTNDSQLACPYPDDVDEDSFTEVWSININQQSNYR